MCKHADFRLYPHVPPEYFLELHYYEWVDDLSEDLTNIGLFFTQVCSFVVNCVHASNIKASTIHLAIETVIASVGKMRSYA